MNFEELSVEMARHKISIPKLAEQIGLSKKAMYSRMSGCTSFKQTEIVKISKVLNLSQERILDIFFSPKVS